MTYGAFDNVIVVGIVYVVAFGACIYMQARRDRKAAAPAPLPKAKVHKR